MNDVDALLDDEQSLDESEVVAVESENAGGPEKDEDNEMEDDNDDDATETDGNEEVSEVSGGHDNALTEADVASMDPAEGSVEAVTDAADDYPAGAEDADTAATYNDDGNALSEAEEAAMDPAEGSVEAAEADGA